MSNPQVYQIAFQLGGSVDSSMRRAFAQANSSLGNMESQSSILNKSMKGLAVTAAATSAAVLAVGAGVKVAVSAAGEYDQAMRDLQVSTGATTGEMKEMKEISKNIYNNNFGEDWNDLSEAVATTKSVTKLTGKELEAATQNALIYRDVFKEDVAESIKVTDTMMKNFGVTNTQAFNLMAQGAQKGLNKSGELLDSANEYAPQFAALGFNANQMFDTFSAGLENGAFNLDKVGDAVKEFNIRSKDGSKASAEAYQALGMDAAKMTKTFAAGGPAAKKAFDTVVKAISNVKDPAEKTAISVGLFGTQAEDLESTVIAAMGSARKQFDMTKETMESIGEIKYDTLGQFWQGIGRQVETGILIPIGEKVLPLLTDLSKSFGKHMPAITAFVENGMDKVGAIFSALPGLFSGTQNRMIDFISIITEAFGQENGLKIINFFKTIKEGVNLAEVYFDKAKFLVEGVIAAFQGNTGKSASLLSSLGLNADTIIQVQTIVSQIVEEIKIRIEVIKEIAGTVTDFFVKAFELIVPYVQPALSAVVGFVSDTLKKIQQFWATDGAAIMQAVKNVFGFILSTIEFIMPAVLFIIDMVWGNIKGVISGALNIIMGVVRIFTGLFTGDFSKMWEGIKQLFSGAIQFVWNLVNLLFYGKILGGIKALATKGIASVSGMWTSIKTFFTQGATKAWEQIVKMGGKIGEAFTKAKNSAVDIAAKMWNGVKTHFDDIVSGARSLPGKIGDGIKSMAGKALDGVTSMGNTLLRGIGKVVNGVAKGLNWALGKLGVDFTINEWTVPQYAKGTNAHPGGPAILGDGGGAELYRTPAGQVGLSPATDTLMNLPKGTQVIPAKETSQLLAQMNIPAYNSGNVGRGFEAVKTGASWLFNKGKDFVGEKAGVVKDFVSEKAGAVKDFALDVFGYLSNPSGLVMKLLEKFGVQVPELPSILSKIAGGGLETMKTYAVSFLKSKMDDLTSAFGNGGSSFGHPFRQSSGFGLRNSPGNGIGSRNHKGIDYAAPFGTPIPSQSGGRVAYSGWSNGFGNNVRVQSGNLQYIYAHNSRNLVSSGEMVRRGQTLALVGSTGNSTGNHLHYEVRRNGVAFNTLGLNGFANGGTVPSSQYAWVGEKGPEIMKVPGGAKVKDNKKSNSLLSRILAFGKGDQTERKESINQDSPTFNFTANVTVEGNADESTIQRALQEAEAKWEMKFREMYRKYQDEMKRLSFQ